MSEEINTQGADVRRGFIVQINQHTPDLGQMLETPEKVREHLAEALECLGLNEEIDFTLEISRLYSNAAIVSEPVKPSDEELTIQRVDQRTYYLMRGDLCIVTGSREFIEGTKQRIDAYAGYKVAHVTADLRAQLAAKEAALLTHEQIYRETFAKLEAAEAQLAAKEAEIELRDNNIRNILYKLVAALAEKEGK